ncbi:MAG: tyrosine-type recombinase/integrase, partial [Pirellulales bacterium]
MSEEITVHVVDYGSGRNLMLRYKDSLTGKHVAKSSGTRVMRAAEREAGKWQAQLRDGQYQRPSKITWEAFRHRYVETVLPGLAIGTATTYEATFNVFERVCNPDRLAKVTTATITDFVAKLRTEGLRDATIARHLRALRVVTRWANRQGLLPNVPMFTMPPRVKGAKAMRGRAITAEEFDRMIEAIPKVVENAAAESWRFYLRGLWASGLRLSESLALRWDDAPDSIVVDLSGRRPMFRIAAAAEKGNQDRLLPMTPDFAAMLQAVPERERRGRVFKLLAIDGKPLVTTRWVVGPMVSDIGASAGVVVDERIKAGKPVRKFASAHDLRRAFGFRWAMKVKSIVVLKELMRHEDISTTMRFYVGQNAEAVADAVWEAAGNTSGNTTETRETDDAKNTLKT